MSGKDSLPIQLYGTSSLCFDKDDFMKDGFSVDNFVRIHQAGGSGGLETLRDDLGIYLKLLRSAMIELINRDYADFVNLSTNLTGLDRLIEALKTPLGQLREEVLCVERLLDEAIRTTSGDLKKRCCITKQKTTLQRLTQISRRLDRLEGIQKCGANGTSQATKNSLAGPYQCDDEGSMGSDLVDRLAAEVNHLNFLVAQCDGAALLDSFKPRVSWLCSYVEVGLERGLREGVFKKDLPLLRQTLRTYASLGSIMHAHALVRSLIKRQLEEVVSESALKSDPRGLPGMFVNILDSVNTICQPLLTVTTGSGSDIVRGYSFYESSAWPEIVASLETRVQHIFNPGNPSAFHQRYCESIDFIELFEKELQTLQRVEAFRELPDYIRFMDQWNLPVYFQIRYQEIGQVVECSLCEDDEGLNCVAISQSRDFIIASSQVVWDSLVKCYNSEVFLLPLLHRFWKLTLLILSRHRTWAANIIANLQKDAMKVIKDKTHPLPSHQQKDSDIMRNVPPRLTGLEAAVALYHDLVTLSDKIPSLYHLALQPIVAHHSEDKVHLIKSTLEEQGQKHVSLCAGLVKVIIDIVISKASAPLRQVGDTPRLYRRTNRASPANHQPYINNAMNILAKFVEENKEKADNKVLIKWLTEACTAISEQYYNLTYEVLSSVHKMEESLRRLKKARDRGLQSGADSTGGLSDDDKIRIQICLDIEYFGEQMVSLSIVPSEIEPYGRLLKMVRNAKEGKFIP